MLVENSIIMKDEFIIKENLLQASGIIAQFRRRSLCIILLQKIIFQEKFCWKDMSYGIIFSFPRKPFLIVEKRNTLVGGGSSQKRSRIFRNKFFNSTHIIITYRSMFRSRSMSHFPPLLKFIMPTRQKVCRGSWGSKFSHLPPSNSGEDSN